MSDEERRGRAGTVTRDGLDGRAGRGGGPDGLDGRAGDGARRSEDGPRGGGTTSVVAPERVLPPPGRDGGARTGPVPPPARVPYLAERLGLGDDVRELLYHPVPTRVNPLDYLGFVTLFLFLNQILTGMLLATAYQPTVAGAYASVQAIMASPAGAVVRGLHAWGADALMVAVACHLLRVFYIGAYKPPRELTWVTGALLLAATVGFAFTGYLLPWDQQAYWATVVGTAMAAYAPVVGQGILRLLRGGSGVTGATLTRFYALHVLALPALFLLVVACHLALVLTHGQTDVEARLPRGYRAAHRKGDTRDFPRGDFRPFWPYTPAQMTVFTAGVAAALVLAATRWRVPLLPPADPLNRAHYQPVPAWYFFGIYQFLKYLPGRLDAVGMVGLPLLGAAVLVGLPFFDRNPSRAPRRRPYAMGAATALVVAGVLLTYLGWRGSKGVSTHAAVVASPTYAADVQPIFTAGCVGCHGAASPSGGLSLTSYAALMKGGRSGAVVQPGNPEGSLLVQVLEGRAPGIPAMPLGQQPLPATQIQTIKNWIAAGAKP